MKRGLYVLPQRIMMFVLFPYIDVLFVIFTVNNFCDVKEDFCWISAVG
jgi:hypothetical protein